MPSLKAAVSRATKHPITESRAEADLEAAYGPRWDLLLISD